MTNTTDNAAHLAEIDNRAYDLVRTICMEAGDGFGSQPPYAQGHEPSITDSDLGWAVIKHVVLAMSPILEVRAMLNEILDAHFTE